MTDNKNLNYSLEKLQYKLNYNFKDVNLLKLALTHRSVATNHNERLEFLGDAILDFVIGELCFNYSDSFNEGQLTRMRSHLVREKFLASCARNINLGPFLYLGSGELKSGGKDRDSTLADAFEAIIASIYLDSNFETVKLFITNIFSIYLEQAKSKALEKDAKTMLQECLQQKNGTLPDYELLGTSGPQHQQKFIVACIVADQENAVAEAKSRRKAEQLAAKLMLNKILNIGNNNAK